MQHIICQTVELLYDGLSYHTIRFATLPEAYINPRSWIDQLAYNCLDTTARHQLIPELRLQLQQILDATPENQAYRLLVADHGIDRITVLSLAEILEISFTSLPDYELTELLEELDTLFDLLIYNFSPMEVPTLS